MKKRIDMSFFHTTICDGAQIVLIAETKSPMRILFRILRNKLLRYERIIMNTYYLAVDIGASGGRHILSHIGDGKIVTEEVHRFQNEMKLIDGTMIWDTDAIFSEILIGMKKCAKLEKIPKSVGIDTWAVDFVLLDEEDKKISAAVAYRDKRTIGMDEYVYEKISEEKLYKRTGIQKQRFNTIYQLMALKILTPKILQKAKCMLMLPDYFNFLLTGKKYQEYTNATTTQLVSPVSKSWDMELIGKLGYPKEIFLPISETGAVIGTLNKEIATYIGYDCKVVLSASHDTASAVAAVPIAEADSKILYISSGTWSLMGTELDKADCSMRSRQSNFTNEGGVDYRFRYLKNIMGLWMIQSVKKEIANDMTYEEICNKASQSNMTSIVDVNDQRFLSPANMTIEIKHYCKETNQQIPETIADIAAVVYNSLAVCYEKTIQEIENLTDRHFDRIHIIGGGANADYLNKLTARYSNRRVCAGPTEATAIGNILVQMRSDGVFDSIAKAREAVKDSFDIKIYEP